MLCQAIKDHKQHTVHSNISRDYVSHFCALGIWLALESKEKIVVLDVEGTDGRERGEDKVNGNS